MKMPNLWIPGATIVPCHLDGGSMMGTGEKYATIHTYESRGYGLSATEGARRLVAAGHGCTGTFNPVTGEIAQMVPANRASRTLVNVSGGVQTNRAGSFHAQFEVIGDAARPWTQDLTDAGKIGLARIIEWLDSWGVPRVWPAGPPNPFPAGPLQAFAPGPSGYYGHSQWKENANGHGDPGAINTTVFFGGSPIILPTPVPTPPVPVPGERPPTQGYHGWVCISKMKRGTRNSESVRHLQKALRDYPGIRTIALSPSGIDGIYGRETEAMVKLVYDTFHLWQPSFGWNKGNPAAPGPKLLAKLGLRVINK